MTHDTWSVFCTEHDYEGEIFFDPPDDPLGGSKRGEITTLCKSTLMTHDIWLVFRTDHDYGGEIFF